MKTIALVLAVLFVCGIAFAEETQRGNYTTFNPGLSEFMNTNDYFSHTHGYDKRRARKMELGVMADVTLWEDAALGVPYALGTQSQYDFSNKEWGFYGKVSVNLSPMIKKLLGQ